MMTKLVKIIYHKFEVKNKIEKKQNFHKQVKKKNQKLKENDQIRKKIIYNILGLKDEIENK